MKRSGCHALRNRGLKTMMALALIQIYDRIQIEHETARGKLTRLMAEIDGLKEFK